MQHPRDHESTESIATGPVLVAGGTGVVGRETVRWLRARNPTLPLLVGGRDQDAARAIADAAGHAEPIAIDLDAQDLGIPADVPISAIAMVAPDDALHGVRLAQRRGAPYVSIANGVTEVAAELALAARLPAAAPIVIAGHWSAGAAVLLALHGARRLDRVESIEIGVVLDPDDPSGPAATADMERLQSGAPGALAFVSGRRAWLTGEASRGRVEAVDGRVLEAAAYAPFDVVGLFAALGARDVRFDLATAESSRRRAGAAAAAEIVVELVDGTGSRSRWTLEFPEGQASLTALCVALSLEAALGLGGGAPAAPGLHLPESVLDPEQALRRLEAAGAVVRGGSAADLSA